MTSADGAAASAAAAPSTNSNRTSGKAATIRRRSCSSIGSAPTSTRNSEELTRKLLCALDDSCGYFAKDTKHPLCDGRPTLRPGYLAVRQPGRAHAAPPGARRSRHRLRARLLPPPALRPLSRLDDGWPARRSPPGERQLGRVARLGPHLRPLPAPSRL